MSSDLDRSINAFEDFKVSIKNNKRRTKEERESTLMEFEKFASSLIASGELTHTTFYKTSFTYSVAVMVDGKDYRLSCTTLDDAIAASRLAQEVQRCKNLRNSLELPLEAPYSLFKEYGWRRFRKTSIYMHREHDFYRNASIGKKNNLNKGYKQNGTTYLNINGRCKFIDVLYETFCGVIPENKYVRIIDIEKPISLINIECVDMTCEQCSKPIDVDYGRKYCSDLCKQRAHPYNMKCHEDLRAFLASKCKSYSCSTDDAMIVSRDRTCVACGLTNLNLRNENPYDPRKLVIDCIDRNPGESYREAHRRDNIQCLCFMCNAMKNNVSNDKFLQLVAYLKGESDLDLSDLSFQKIGTKVSEGPQHRFHNTLRFHDPTIKHPWLHVSKLFEYQSGVDAIFNKVPLLFTTGRSIFNCSVDQIKAGDHTHGFQLLPLFMNFAKSTMTNEEVRMEFEARGWLKSSHTKKIILPMDYAEKSYVLKNMGKSGIQRRSLALNNKRKKLSRHHCEAISKRKRGKINMQNRRKMILVAIPKTPFYGPPNRFNYYEEAIRDLGLSKFAASNICMCLQGKLHTAYGYRWEDWT